MPANILTSNVGDVYIASIEENVSTTTLYTQQSLQRGMRQALERLGETIKETVKDEYFSRRQTYQNTATTLAKKGFKPPLEETGKLKNAVVERRNRDVRVEQTGGRYSLTVEWKFPTSGGTGLYPKGRKNNNYVYLWSHEFGTVKPITQILARKGKGFRLIPAYWSLDQKDFFLDGLQKGIDKGSTEAGKILAQSIDMETISRRSQYTVHPPASFGLISPMFPSSAIGWAWYVVPPSMYYAWIGMAYDIAGALKGSFFSMNIATGYGRQMALGRMGISKKVVRRKIRGRIWMRD